MSAKHDLDRGLTLLAHARDQLGTSPSRWTLSGVDAAAALQAQAEPLLTRACGRVEGDPALQAAARLPGLDLSARTTADLCGAAVAAAAALADVVAVARAFVERDDDGGPPGQRLLDLLAATRAPLEKANARLGTVMTRLAADLAAGPPAPLRSRLEEALRQLRPAADQASAWSAAARLLPAAVGSTRPLTYLVLLMNPSELRPAGGLFGAVGTITFAKGTPTNLDIRDYDALNPLLKQRFPVPAPLARQLTFYNDSLELGDAGWDPDFPTTARLAESMYESAVPGALAGTIAIDPYAVGALLNVTGPVDVPGYGTFEAADFFPRLNAIVNARSDSAVGKRALPIVGQTVLERVLNQPIGRWPDLLDVVLRQAAGRHIEIYSHDSQTQQALAQAGYTGALLDPVADDYLMVVDANLGGTKGDWYVKKQVSIATEVYPTGLARHQVQLTYDMPQPVDTTDRLLNPGGGAYEDYVRVYIPEDATVAAFSYSMDGGAPGPALDAIALEHGRQAVGAFFSLPRGHAATLTLTYEVPLRAGRAYTLYLQKQAGIPGTQTVLTTTYPGGRDRRQFGLAQDATVSYRW